MKNKFNSDDDDSRLIKTLKFYNMVIAVGSFFVKAKNISLKFSQTNICINYNCSYK